MMLFKYLASLPLVILAVAAQCDDVHMLIAVGHGESYPGAQKSIADLVCAKLPSCGYSNIQFPSGDQVDFCAAVTIGINSGQAALSSYVAECPDSKVVLMGWSQGAVVVGDMISGGGGRIATFAANCMQEDTEGLDPDDEPGSHVVAVALYGSPRHTANEPYNQGQGSNGVGDMPRSGASLDLMRAWGDRVADFCAAGDMACTEQNVGPAHGSYFNGASPQTAAAWILSMLE